MSRAPTRCSPAASTGANDRDRAPLWPAFDIWEVAQHLRAGAVSSAEIVEAHLARIERLDGTLKACVTVMRDEARAAARRADLTLRRRRPGTSPLLGVPIAVKDLCYTKGVRTMAGTSIYAGFLPDHDATVVAKLSQAGAVLLGKLNLTEGAMGGYNPARDIPVNPWGEDLWPGASSSGSGSACRPAASFRRSAPQAAARTDSSPPSARG